MQKYKVYTNTEYQIIFDNWDKFCARHVLIEAAGGLVYNLKNQLLMIFRNEKWDLPKGKLETGENSKTCAMREVEEECGVSNLHIVKELKNTYHTYEMNGISMLKRTYWFRMATDYNSDLTPQIKEGITKAEWVSKKDVLSRMENTFLSLSLIHI